MIEVKSEWILPENLRKQEAKEREEVDLGKFNGLGDFGSYYGFRTGMNKKWIEPHAVFADKTASDYVESLDIYARSKGISLNGKIIDIGCAVGSITNALSSKNPNGETSGLDISQDAIQYARTKYNKCKFYCRSADDLDVFPDNYFDVIHCSEFYPFTRTNDIDYQLKYLKLFYGKLREGGSLILRMVAPKSEGLCNSYRRIADEVKAIGYKSAIKRSMLFKYKYPSKLLNRLGIAGMLYNMPLYCIFASVIKVKNMIDNGGISDYVYLLKK